MAITLLLYRKEEKTPLVVSGVVRSVPVRILRRLVRHGRRRELPHAEAAGLVVVAASAIAPVFSGDSSAFDEDRTAVLPHRLHRRRRLLVHGARVAEAVGARFAGDRVVGEGSGVVLSERHDPEEDRAGVVLGRVGLADDRRDEQRSLRHRLFRGPTGVAVERAERLEAEERQADGQEDLGRPVALGVGQVPAQRAAQDEEGDRDRDRDAGRHGKLPPGKDIPPCIGSDEAAPLDRMIGSSFEDVMDPSAARVNRKAVASSFSVVSTRSLARISVSSPRRRNSEIFTVVGDGWRFSNMCTVTEYSPAMPPRMMARSRLMSTFTSPEDVMALSPRSPRSSYSRCISSTVGLL